MGDVKWSDVKRIASNEIGYHEQGNNWTKYAEELDSINYFNTPKQNIAWCATFVAWCIYKGADPDPKGTALAAQYQPYKDNCGCSCKYNAQYYRNAGEFYSEPEEGDIFFVGESGSETHQGFVLKVNGDGTICTIEGNHDDQVTSCTRNISQMSGFGRPWWTPEDWDVSEPNIDKDAKAALDAIRKIIDEYYT